MRSTLWIDFFGKREIHALDTPLAVVLVGLGAAIAAGMGVVAVRLALVIPMG